MIEFYSQSPDWVKAAIVIGWPGLALALLWLLLWYRVATLRLERQRERDVS